MSGFLLDTHVWLWVVEDSPRLSRTLRRQIDRSASDCWLSPLSTWELGLLVSRGRYKIDAPLREWVEEEHQRFSFREARVTHEVAIVAREIALRKRDPADLFIAASAVVYGLTLMTSDENLIGLDWLPTLS